MPPTSRVNKLLKEIDEAIDEGDSIEEPEGAVDGDDPGTTAIDRDDDKDVEVPEDKEAQG